MTASITLPMICKSDYSVIVVCFVNVSQIFLERAKKGYYFYNKEADIAEVQFGIKSW